MPEGHDTTIEVSNIMSFVLYTEILKQSVLKPASPGITLSLNPGPFYYIGHKYFTQLLSITQGCVMTLTQEKLCKV